MCVSNKEGFVLEGETDIMDSTDNQMIARRVTHIVIETD